MEKFIVMFLAPVATLDEWMKTPEAERAAAEKKMREDWDVWMAEHADMIKETNAGGKTMRVTTAGSSAHRNELMLYSIVEGESHDAVAKAYEGHPHLGIPNASIEITAIRPM